MSAMNIPAQLIMVAGGLFGGYSWSVLCEPGVTQDTATSFHQETAIKEINAMKKHGKSYRIYQYSMGRGKIFMELEKRAT